MSKKLTTFLLLLVLSISTNQLIAQNSNGIFFQAVARDNFSNPAKDRKIYVQSSIIQSTPTGTKVLTEEHQANTDATGVFNISLGNGVRVGGTAAGLASIDWSIGPFYLNLKVAITPIGGSSNWDYTKEWVDMGTTSFGAVPFALYSASSAKVDDKLNVTDTTKMLAVYAKAMSVKTLENSLATKLSLADSTKYTTPTQLAAKTFDTTSLSNRINIKANANDVNASLNLKADISDLTTKLSLADSTKYLTPTGSAASLTNFPTFNQNTTGNSATATIAGNITATTNTTLTSLSNLATVGTITSGVWSGTAVAVEKGGTGLTSAGSNGQVLTSTVSGTLTWTTLSSDTHTIGESYGGGIVFYVYDNGKHGLIAATSDQSTGIRWRGGSSNTFIRATANGVGAGLKNTAIIIANQGALDGNAFAATVCNEYSVTVNGVTYGDWYLPSKHELNLMFYNIGQGAPTPYTNIGNLATNIDYWSSTEVSTPMAFSLHIGGGYGSWLDNPKSSSYYVRAIRAF